MGKRQPRPEPITFEEITSAQVGGFDQFLRFRPGEASPGAVITLPEREETFQVHPVEVYLKEVYLIRVHPMKVYPLLREPGLRLYRELRFAAHSRFRMATLLGNNWF